MSAQPPPPPHLPSGSPPPYPPGGPAGPPYHPPPAYGPTPPAPRAKSNRGCLIALVIVGVLMVVSAVAVYAGVAWLGGKAGDAIGKVEPCPYITEADASEALGIDAEANLFTGVLGRVLNITDARVLPDKESCILQQRSGPADQQSQPGLGRAVRYIGRDAAALYDHELTVARGVTESRGDGVTIESQSYLNREVPGLGDRAFCTKSSGTLAGVLVLRGDTLVYVALFQAGVQPGVDLSNPDNARLTTDDPACDAAVVLARKILARE